MPRPLTLYLLDAQREDFDPRVTLIMSDEAWQRRDTMKLHERWMETGALADKREFAFALRTLGRLTGNRGMVRYAQKLLGES